MKTYEELTDRERRLCLWKERFDLLFSILTGRLVLQLYPEVQEHAERLLEGREAPPSMEEISVMAEELSTEHGEVLDAIILAAFKRAKFAEPNELIIQIPLPDGRVSF